MKENPVISVVMSVYNGAKYLTEAIESVLSQTYKDFEFIIINDGSTDQSLEVIKRYQEQDSRIVLISRENRGLPYSLNEGIDIAKGKYIARMDADDISLPTRFAKQVAFMEANPNIGVCGGWIDVFSADSITRTVRTPALYEEARVRLIFSPCFMHPTVIVRKDLLDKHNLRYDTEFINSQDYELWSRIVEYTEVSNIQEVLLRYRRHRDSVTYTADGRKIELRYRLLKQVFEKNLQKMGVHNSEEENRLHFTLQLNDRIAREDIDLRYLDRYLNKLLDANRSSKVFHQGYLEQLLVKKFLVVIYYKIKRRDLSFLHSLLYKKFWLGVWFMLR